MCVQSHFTIQKEYEYSCNIHTFIHMNVFIHTFKKHLTLQEAHNI